MRIFLTGGTGFVGNHFLRAAPDRHTIIALRRPGSPSPQNLRPGLRWLEKPMDAVDATDLAGTDVFVHLASPGVSPKPAGWAELFHWNVIALLRLMEGAHAAGVRRIVVVGTANEYGRAAELYDTIPPEAPLAPTTAYAASKAAGFMAAHGFAVERQMELCYPRLFAVFGDGQYEQNFWPALRRAAGEGRDFAMTPGEQVRDYIPVEEVATEFWYAVEREDVVAGTPLVTNIGSGQPVTMRDFAEQWWEHWGAKGQLRPGALPYRPNEVMRFVPQVERRNKR